MREKIKRKREKQISLASLKMKKDLRSSLMRQQTFPLERPSMKI